MESWQFYSLTTGVGGITLVTLWPYILKIIEWLKSLVQGTANGNGNGNKITNIFNNELELDFESIQAFYKLRAFCKRSWPNRLPQTISMDDIRKKLIELDW